MALEAREFPKLLILATNHVGNNLFLTPAIRLLKKHRYEIEIDVVTMSNRGAEAFEGNPDIGRTHKVYCGFQMNRLARRYSCLVGLHRDKAAQYFNADSVPSWIIDAPERGTHRAEHALNFVSRLVECRVTDDDRRYVLCPASSDYERVAKLTSSDRRSDRLIGVHLGSGRTSVHGWKFWYGGRGRDKRLWPEDRYLDLAKLLKRREPELRFVLTGTSNERFLARRFVEEIPGTINLIGATSLRQMAALMSSLSLFITHDTGALHVAASTDVPLIGLFGPTDPAQTGPYPLGRPRTTVVKFQTMDEISAEEVVLRARSVLFG